MSNAVDARKNIILIGAGIAGLAAGCYAQMNGYQTEIFELHDQPGGLCTAWQRQGYTFDGCLYYLFGSGKNQPFYQIWEELGALQGREFVHHDEFMRVVASDGKTLIVYSDPDRLEAHLKSLSAIDSPLIEDFCDGIRVFTRFDLSLLYQKPRSLMSLRDWIQISLKLLPFVAPLSVWGSVSAEEFANDFQDPFLRRAIAQMFSWSQIPVMVGMSLIAYRLGGLGNRIKPTCFSRWIQNGSRARASGQSLLLGSEAYLSNLQSTESLFSYDLLQLI